MLKELLEDYLKSFPSKYQVYLICLIILIPNILVYIILKSSNFEKYKNSKTISNIGISFAIGALMANLFSHILPEVFEKILNSSNRHSHSEHSHNHSHSGEENEHHSHMKLEYSLNILFSFIFYYTLDKISDIYNPHSHTQKTHKELKNPKQVLKHQKELKLASNSENDNFGKNLTFYIMDIFHNTSDGLAIYTIYKANPLIGISLTFSFFWEEFFHQLSDYCILLKRGWKLKKIFVTQIFTSLFIFFGAFFGNVLSDEFEIHLNFFVLVSLIYNVFSQIVPEIKEEKIDLWFGVELVFLVAGFWSTVE